MSFNTGNEIVQVKEVAEPNVFQAYTHDDENATGTHIEGPNVVQPRGRPDDIHHGNGHQSENRKPFW
jgi:hypothetical protein